MLPSSVTSGHVTSTDSIGKTISRQATRSFNTLRLKASRGSLAGGVDSQPLTTLPAMRSSLTLAANARRAQQHSHHQQNQEGRADDEMGIADHHSLSLGQDGGRLQQGSKSDSAALTARSGAKAQEAGCQQSSTTAASSRANISHWTSLLLGRWRPPSSHTDQAPPWQPASPLPVPHLGSLQGRNLNLVLALVASASFTEWGYEQGVLSGLLTLEDFQRAIPFMAPHESENYWCEEVDQCVGSHGTQAIGVGIYQLGCFLGAIAVLQCGDGWGRRNSAFWGTLVVIAGTVLQAVAQGSIAVSYTLFIVGRVIAGLGNGVVTASIPTWQSECAKPHMRGLLVMLSGALISGGIALSYLMNLIFFYSEGSTRWRGPIMLQTVICCVVLVGIPFLPDSPRWLLAKGQTDQCRLTLARLAGQHVDSLQVESDMRILQNNLAAEKAGGPFKYRELLTNGPSQNFHRTVLAITAQAFQQMTGINLTTYYLSLLFERSLGLAAELARILSFANGLWYFLTSLCALPLVEKMGRRKLLFLGAGGMTFSFLVLAGVVSTSKYINDTPVLSQAGGAWSVLLLFLYVGFFGVSYLGLTWLYPAEITPLRIRIQANGLSTATNWLTNFLVVMVTPPGISKIGWGMYAIFGVLCAAQIPIIYKFFPETKGRSLEELDVIWAYAYEHHSSVVTESLRIKRLEGDELDEWIARYLGPGSAAGIGSAMDMDMDMTVVTGVGSDGECDMWELERGRRVGAGAGTGAGGGGGEEGEHAHRRLDDEELFRESRRGSLHVDRPGPGDDDGEGDGGSRARW